MAQPNFVKSIAVEYDSISADRYTLLSLSLSLEVVGTKVTSRHEQKKSSLHFTSKRGRDDTTRRLGQYIYTHIKR